MDGKPGDQAKRCDAKGKENNEALIKELKLSSVVFIYIKKHWGFSFFGGRKTGTGVVGGQVVY